MARWAMVQNIDGRVCEIAAAPFDVHSDFQWVDATSSPMTDNELMHSTYVNGVFQPKQQEQSNVITVEQFLTRWTNAEYRAVSAAAWRGASGNAKAWDIVVVARPEIELDRQKTINLKADLVAGGILTQARADQIFSIAG
jgi:hypothetical protein